MAALSRCNWRNAGRGNIPASPTNSRHTSGESKLPGFAESAAWPDSLASRWSF